MMSTSLPCVVLVAAVAASACTTTARPAPPADPLSLSSPEALYENGLAAADQGDFIRAEQYLAAAVERGFPEAEAVPALVKVCLASSRFRSALRHAVPYLERHPTEWSLRYLVGTIYLGIGDSQSARIELEKVTMDAPDQGPPHYLLGLLARDELGDPALARQHFESYLKIVPSGSRALEVQAALRDLEQPTRAPAAVDNSAASVEESTDDPTAATPTRPET